MSAKDEVVHTLTQHQGALTVLFQDFDTLDALATQRAGTIADLQAEVARLEAALAAAEEGGATQAEVDALTVQVAALQAELAALKTTTGPGDTTRFTPAELTSIRWVWSGLGKLGNALRQLTFAIRDNTAPRDELYAYLTGGGIIRQYYETFNALGSLLDVTVLELGTPAGDALKAAPRADRVAKAWFHLNRVIQFIPVTQTAMTNPETNIQRTKTVHLRDALSALRQVNQTLPYATPHPIGYPNIVGPHGNYEDWQWKLWRGGHYTFEGMSFTLEQAFKVDPDVVARRAKYYKAFNSWSVIPSQFAKALMLTASVTVSADEVNQGPFFRLLDALQQITDLQVIGAPARFHEVLSELRDLP
ncbi:MAG TPA: hypothetical protein VLK35_06285, partial [Methylomirabilota bacterium]|nr:hypothetical protein [Methylomirabilota bacterium]